MTNRLPWKSHPTALCRDCGETDEEKFYVNNSNKSGFHYLCKACDRKRKLEKGVYRKSFGYKTKKLYGVTLEEYRALVNSPCEICGEIPNPNRMALDHTRDGSYHGVLCHRCNMAIGQMQHNPERLEKAAAYVRRTRAVLEDFS